jgi:uncharacterized membrane protein required for colicin V production
VAVDIGGFLGSIRAVDLVLALYFMGFFVLGFAQGTLRRLIGLASVLFSFLVAANVAGPLGTFLGANWTQFGREYSSMIGFLTVFVAAALAFALVVQGFYKPQPLFEKARFVDELLGGLLGLIQAAVILGAFVIILDQFFRIPGIPLDNDEIHFLRDAWLTLDGSRIVAVFRESLIPGFLVPFGFLVPDTIELFYRVESA